MSNQSKRIRIKSMNSINIKSMNRSKRNSIWTIQDKIMIRLSTTMNWILTMIRLITLSKKVSFRKLNMMIIMIQMFSKVAISLIISPQRNRRVQASTINIIKQLKSMKFKAQIFRVMTSSKVHIPLKLLSLTLHTMMIGSLRTKLYSCTIHVLQSSES